MKWRRRQKRNRELRIETTPMDNFLDPRPDGTLRPGDMGYEFLKEVMERRVVGTAFQREDGTWETHFEDTE